MNLPRVRQDAKEVVRVALPLYLSMAAVSLSALINTAALGRYGTAALAGFAVTLAVYAPAVAAVSGAVRGVLPFVADDPRAVVRDGTWLALVVGLLGAGAVACVPLLARVTTVEELGLLPWFAAIAVLVNGYSAMMTSCLVGLGQGRTVMRAGLLRAAGIALLSPPLVSRMGLNGAGVALLTADVIGCLVTAYGLRGHLAWPGKVHFGHLRRLAGVGIPMAGTVLVKFGVLGVLAIATARVSTEAAATHNIAMALVGLAFTAAVAIGQGMVPMIATRGSHPRGAVTAALAVTVATLSVVCAAIVLVKVVPLFSRDPAVVQAVTGLLPLVVLVIFADGVQAVLGFGLVGLRRTTPSFVVFAACYGLLALVAVPVTAHLGLTGLWGALAIANLLVVIGQGLAFRHCSRNRSEPPQAAEIRSSIS